MIINYIFIGGSVIILLYALYVYGYTRGLRKAREL